MVCTGNKLKTDNTGRIRTLQASRFLFVFLIYLSHSVGVLAGSPFDFGGESGVAFFFVLSGFVLSYGYGPRVSRGQFRLAPFFWRHFWHMYPLHIFLFVVAVALDARIGHTYDMVQIVSSVLLVQTWIPSAHTLFVGNGVSWFLCDILFCYLVFASLYRWLMRVPVRGLLCGFGAFALVYGVAAYNVPRDMVNCTLYVSPLLRCVDFALGIMAYRYYKLMPAVPSGAGAAGRWPLALFPLADIALLVVSYAAYQLLPAGLRCAMLFWPVMPVLVVRLASADGSGHWLVKLLYTRAMMWLGSLSFEIFMVHLLVIRVAQHMLLADGGMGHAAVCLVCGMGATVAVAWGVQKAYVNPLSKVITQINNKKWIKDNVRS